ncbi:hypothetical protein TUMSATVNIG1_59600 (plasmid) [Vibrio nigripulchritudo]|nr:hypothetical protein VNTUMSATTG_59110 [Vibrio nigripulchritudo]BDU35351.1 hypothetical protein TUMSATVNIG1_59600 [Vibrio nigripulchritudo]
MVRKLIEQASNAMGDTYKLYQTGKSFVTFVHYAERSSRYVTLPEEQIERRHRSYSAAINSNLRRSFNF